MASIDLGEIRSKYRLDDEINVAEAAELLGVSYDTVRRMIDCGDLAARNAAPSSSSNERWRIPVSAIVEMRSAYQTFEPEPIKRKQRQPMLRRTIRQPKHIRLV